MKNKISNATSQYETLNTLPLFARRSAAHERINTRKQQVYERILEFARARGRSGFIVDEIVSEWSCSHNHVTPRVSELLKIGWLVLTKHTRRTRSGSPVCVCVIPEFAPERQDH